MELTRLFRWLRKKAKPQGAPPKVRTRSPRWCTARTTHAHRAIPAENSRIHSPPKASAAAHTHVPDTSTNLFNAESVKQLTPHLLFKNILLQKEKKYNAV